MSSLRFACVVLFGFAFTAASSACGSETSNGSQSGGSSGAEGGADAGGDSGRYAQGIYTCCAEGEERSCCPPETLPDPSVGRTATCFKYGGARGSCVPAGGTLEAKDICSICCPGLERLEMTAPADGGTCVDTGPPSIFVCGACGDGTCGTGENRCNCPKDCTGG